MDWLSQLNDALDYIEAHLDGEMDISRAAAIACCGTYHFTRMFPYLAGLPLSEYIRRRKMTRAAFDLKSGKQKVIDIAAKYGYESPTAFTRAFVGVHGISPSAARADGAALKAYPPISFKITIKGVSEMDYRIEKKEAFRIVGVRDPLIMDMEQSFERVPIFWAEAGQSGAVGQVASLINAEPFGVLGVCSCNPEGEQNYYYIAAATDKPVPEGMYEFTVPASTWAIFPGSGSPADIQPLEKRIMAEWMPTSGYAWANAPDVEVYLNDDPADMRFEVWLPVVPANKA